MLLRLLLPVCIVVGNGGGCRDKVERFVNVVGDENDAKWALVLVLLAGLLTPCCCCWCAGAVAVVVVVIGRVLR